MSKIDINEVENLVVEDVCPRDYPEFEDAFFQEGFWKESGLLMSEDDLDALAEQYPEVLNEMAHEVFRN